MNFQPDYSQIETVLLNKRPERLPLYEHHIDRPFIEKAIGKEIGLEGNKPGDFEEYYRQIIGFWKDMTYDAFDYEAAICDIFPGHGAITGGMLGPIQTRDDFNRYPFDEIPQIFWDTYSPHLDAIRKVIPDGMKAYGGCGYGVFESSEDLVGYESLAILQYTDPDLFTDLFSAHYPVNIIHDYGVAKHSQDIFYTGSPLVMGIYISLHKSSTSLSKA